MASRGRKAPSKGKKGPTNNGRPGSAADGEGTPAVDGKPALMSSTSNLKNEFLRAESDAPGELGPNGFATPPPASATPFVNGVASSVAHDSQADPMDMDSSGPAAQPEDLDEDDAEFKTWKQITKKDRAMAASERHKLFRSDQLNPDEPAILRSKAGMRRWARQQKQYTNTSHTADAAAELEEQSTDAATGETLAEGIEKDEDRSLPDYYDLVTALPDLDKHLVWAEDSEGNVVPQSEEYLRLFPQNQFVATESLLGKKIDSNMRQMQETRKVCAKIGVVKQMQIQAQTYQNQFQKYDPQPFLEQDIGPVAVSEDGPIMDPELCRTAFQRSVGKIFYQAGFEDFQPSALEAITDVASDFFGRLAGSLRVYMEAPKKASGQSAFSGEEQVLHCLDEVGIDLDSLDSYVKDDMERLGSKLVVVHERLRSHLAELLVRTILLEGLCCVNILPASSTWRQCGARRCRRFQRWQRAICGWRFCRGSG